VERGDWNRRYAGRELLWTASPNRFLVAETEELAPGRALDLACGEGRNAVWLAQRGWTVTGVDFSEVALDKALQLARAGEVEVRWVQADLREYRPEPHAYDLVLLFYLQVPAEERRRIVRAAAGGVAPGGTLLLVAHDRSNLEQGYGGPQEPAVLYTAGDVVSDLEGTGLRIERAEPVERPVRDGESEHVALDALVRAARPSATRRDA
jgi:SAM-dependent methyltransferase